MSKILDYIVDTFGYANWSEFVHSAFHHKVMGLVLSSSMIVSTINAAIQEYFGLKPFLVSGVIVLLLTELYTGLKARKKKEKVEDREFSSKKLSRWSLKAFMWSAWIYITWSFRDQFIDTNVAAYELFDWIHTGLLVYMFLEYLISIDENVARITGKPNTFLQIVIGKLKSFLGIKDGEL